jgi:hypothetical protein
MAGNIKRWGRPRGATGLRDPSKRTADTAGLDEGSESKHGSKGADGGAEGAGQYAGPHYHTLF